MSSAPAAATVAVPIAPAPLPAPVAAVGAPGAVGPLVSFADMDVASAAVPQVKRKRGRPPNLLGNASFRATLNGLEVNSVPHL